MEIHVRFEREAPAVLPLLPLFFLKWSLMKAGVRETLDVRNVTLLLYNTLALGTVFKLSLTERAQAVVAG